MNLKRIFAGTLLALLCTACGGGSGSNNINNSGNNDPRSGMNESRRKLGMNEVMNFKDQITGITVSTQGRTFVSIPRWRDGIPYSVGEIKPDGSVAPYPDASWNSGDGSALENKFVCIQSVIAHENSLYVLDPSNPKMKGVVGSPKLYEFDLQTNTLKKVWSFPEKVAPRMSYLNDLRIDSEKGLIYMTDSGLGALVVLDLKTGKSRRLLDKHPSTKSEVMVLRSQGKPFLKENGSPRKIHSDGIALFEGQLYYHALTAHHLYRIPTAALANEALSEQSLAGQVEDLSTTPPTDGMLFDRKGNLIMGDLESGAVIYRTPDGQIKTLAENVGLHWPDTFALDQNGQLVFTDSHLDEVTPGLPLPEDAQFNIFRLPTP